MGIKDTFGMEGIRRLFERGSFVENPLGKSLIVKHLSSLNSKRQIKGARSLVSRMQRGEDLFELCNDVIKAMDTRDPELKRMLNLYLVKYVQGWPAKQLICINTVLKDLGDVNSEMRHCAIQDSGLLGDGAVIKNYVNPLKEHGVSALPETRRKVADSLRNYFRKDPRLFHDEDLCDLLRDLVFDEDAGVCASALNSVQAIEKETRVLSTKDIYILFGKAIKTGNREILGSLLEVMNNRAEDFLDASPLVPLLRSCSLRIFRQASDLAISIDPSYRQIVFDHLKGFLNSKDEELYLVLDYAESLLDHVKYDNSCFAIYHSDRKYNKIKKLKILFKRLDSISVSEIKNQCRDEELLGVILKESLIADYLIEEPFKYIRKADEIIRVLYSEDAISEKWSGLIEKFLMSAREVQERQKYIYLCGRYVHEIPSEVIRIQSLYIPSLVNETARFYLILHRRGVVNLEETLGHLRLVQKSPKDRIRAVINELKTRGIGVFSAFCDIKKRDLNSTKACRSVGIKYEEKTTSILDGKPYYGLSEDGFLRENSGEALEKFREEEKSLREECSSLERGETQTTELSSAGESSPFPGNGSQCPALFLGKEDEENVWLRFAESHRPVEGKRAKEKESTRLIDTLGLKGILAIAGEEVILQVDVLESPLVIYYRCKGRLNSIKIDGEGTFSLFTIGLPVINSEFSLTIGKSNYEIYLGIRSLMNPFECSKDEFERKFHELRDHILLGEIDTGKAYAVDNHRFSFSVLGSKFYGKHLNGQAILKGPRKLLGLF